MYTCTCIALLQLHVHVGIYMCSDVPGCTSVCMYMYMYCTVTVTCLYLHVLYVLYSGQVFFLYINWFVELD